MSGLARLHVSQLTKELRGTIKCQILAILCGQIVALVATINHHLRALIPSVEVSRVLVSVLLRVAVVGPVSVRLLLNELVRVHTRSSMHGGVVVVRVILPCDILRLVVNSVVVLVVMLLSCRADRVLLRLLMLFGEHAGEIVEIL